jgi:hypothetical protein
MIIKINSIQGSKWGMKSIKKHMKLYTQKLILALFGIDKKQRTTLQCIPPEQDQQQSFRLKLFAKNHNISLVRHNVQQIVASTTKTRPCLSYLLRLPTVKKVKDIEFLNLKQISFYSFFARKLVFI